MPSFVIRKNISPHANVWSIFFYDGFFLKTINIMILKDAPFLISTHSFVLRNNKATYTYTVNLFRIYIFV